MPKQEIWRVLLGGDYEIDYAYMWDDNSPSDEIEKHAVLSLEQIADFCDRNAEGRNNHTFCGSHRILAAFLHRKLGRAQATVLMREIAEYGGLDGMSGAGGEADAFADFGIKDCWKDWKLDNV